MIIAFLPSITRVHGGALYYSANDVLFEIECMMSFLDLG